MYLLFGVFHYHGKVFAMAISNKNPLGSWKGFVPINFTGRISNSQNGSSISNFDICEVVNGAPLVGKIQTEGKVINLGPQNVTTQNGDYIVTLYSSTINGQKVIMDGKEVLLLGPATEKIVIRISADGYSSRDFSLTKNVVFVGQNNYIDIKLEPNK
jgi:hypothetical protein